MSRSLRSEVAARAGHRCEYCHLPEAAVPVAFHVEHVIAKQHCGGDDLSNRAYACQRCNLAKGPNLAGIDPDTQEMVPLFHPRLQDWDEHFAWQGAMIAGLTPIGRATVQVLQMNAPRRLRLRAQLRAQGLLG